ncbi:MAG: hypothetical protein EA374_03935 [Acholeplasmatales bacterium]|nr:MAG: hypothetical protein EA374_03935 [Acholeplasmatales bacterium]
MSTKRLHRLAYGLFAVLAIITCGLFWWFEAWRPVLMVATLAFVAIGLITFQSMRAYTLFRQDAIATRKQQRPCPFCEAPVYKTDTVCPYCRRAIQPNT